MLSRFYFLTVISVFSFSPLSSQSIYQGVYGGTSSERGQSVTWTQDKNFLNFGYTAELGTADFMLTKTSYNGNLLWAKALGGPSGDFGHQIQETADSGFVMTGWTASYGAGDDDVLLIKTDSEGTVEWSKTYGRDGTDRGRSVRQTADGGFVVLGHTSAFGLSLNDLYLIRTDAMGDTLFVKTYGGIDATNENGWWIEETSDGGFITTGNTAHGPGFTNLLMVKFDSQGDTLWTRSFGGAGGQTSGHCVIETENNEYVATGWTTSFGQGGRDVFTIKTDQDGAVIWSKTYGGSGDDESQGIVAFGDDGNYAIAGTTNSFDPDSENGDNAYLLHISGSGSLDNSHSVGGAGDEVLYALTSNFNDEVLFAGWTNSYGSGNDDLFMIRSLFAGSVCDAGAINSFIEEPATEMTNAPLSQSFISQQTQVLDVNLSIDQALEFESEFICYELISSVNELDLNDLLVIYPNPSNGLVTFEIEHQVQNIEVMNAAGKVVKRTKVIPKDQILDLSGEPSGIYLIKITTEAGVSTQRVVLE